MDNKTHVNVLAFCHLRRRDLLGFLLTLKLPKTMLSFRHGGSGVMAAPDANSEDAGRGPTSKNVGLFKLICMHAHVSFKKDSM